MLAQHPALESGFNLFRVGLGQGAEGREAVVAVDQDPDVGGRQQVFAGPLTNGAQDRFTAGNAGQCAAGAYHPFDRGQVLAFDDLLLAGGGVQVGDNAGVAPDGGLDGPGAQPAGELKLVFGLGQRLQVGQAGLPGRVAVQLDDVAGVDKDAQVAFDGALG